LIARKPNEIFDVGGILNETSRFINPDNYLHQDINENDVGFYQNATNLLDDYMLELINKYWFYFEQPTLVVCKDLKKFLDKDFNSLVGYSWKDITKISDSFVLFRGVEEEVLWVGKSQALDFPDMEGIQRFEATLH